MMYTFMLRIGISKQLFARIFVVSIPCTVQQVHTSTNPEAALDKTIARCTIFGFQLIRTLLQMLMAAYRHLSNYTIYRKLL